jgi:hypothetical protein
LVDRPWECHGTYSPLRAAWRPKNSISSPCTALTYYTTPIANSLAISRFLLSEFLHSHQPAPSTQQPVNRSSTRPPLIPTATLSLAHPQQNFPHHSALLALHYYLEPLLTSCSRRHSHHMIERGGGAREHQPYLHLYMSVQERSAGPIAPASTLLARASRRRLSPPRQDTRPCRH